MYARCIVICRFRGGLVTVSEIAQNVGILLGYIFSFVLAGLPQNLNWRVMLAIGAIASVRDNYRYCDSAQWQ